MVQAPGESLFLVIISNNVNFYNTDSSCVVARVKDLNVYSVDAKVI